jgi:hypothetical protein
VRDGISFARKGIPAVAIVSEAFWAQGDFVARSLGMPDVPRVQIPHPVAGTGVAAMTVVAEKIADEIISALGIGTTDQQHA